MGRFCVLTLSEDNVAYTNPIANCIDTYNRPSIFTTVKTYLYTTGALGSPLTTQSYTYNSQNQRTDLGYDASGNLTSLNGYTFTWSGRRLTAAVNANTNISYTYNHNGIRTSKTVNGTTIYYEVDENNNVVKQYELVNDAETNVIEFVYDSSNSPIYFTYNNATYYYEKNLQGDIVAILDGSGNTVVEYTYDIWGKSVSITGSLADTVGAINPLRYRGYYYDTETQLYYLQSRYYSPDLMRFISQDDPVFSNAQGEPLGSNLYVYCLNDPINSIDPNGEWVATVGAAMGATLILGVSVSAAIVVDGKGNWGLMVSLYLPIWGYGIGASGFIGYFWKYKSVYEYKNAVMNTHSVGYMAGVDIVHDYPRYRYMDLKARLVGFQISISGKSFTVTYTPNSIVSYYIPLNKGVTRAWNQLRSFMRTVRVRFAVRRR